MGGWLVIRTLGVELCNGRGDVRCGDTIRTPARWRYGIQCARRAMARKRGESAAKETGKGVGYSYFLAGFEGSDFLL